MMRILMVKVKEASHSPFVRKMLPPGLFLFFHNQISKPYYQRQVAARVNEHTVMLADYPRCGIGWLQFVIATVLHQQRTGEFTKLSHEQMRCYAPSLAGRKDYQVVRFNGNCNLLKTHYPYVTQFKRGIVIYRNPFDAICSYYVHKLMEENEVIVGYHRHCSKEEAFLVQEARAYCRFYETWSRAIRQKPQYFFVIKYEDLLEYPGLMFERLFTFLGLDIATLPQDGLKELVNMYKRSDVSTPLLGKKDLDEALRIKFSLFDEIQPVMKPEVLQRINAGIKERLDSVVAAMDTLRCKP